WPLCAQSVGQLRYLHSFPTRRSSDLSEINRKSYENPRVHLTFNDARNYMNMTRKQYDIIISEPSNPWIAGVASLFTSEFYDRAADRKSTRLNSSHQINSYAVFCLKKNEKQRGYTRAIPVHNGAVVLEWQTDCSGLRSSQQRPVTDRRLYAAGWV